MQAKASFAEVRLNGVFPTVCGLPAPQLCSPPHCKGPWGQGAPASPPTPVSASTRAASQDMFTEYLLLWEERVDSHAASQNTSLVNNL